MPRTKMTRKKSSMKKKLGQHSMLASSGSVESLESVSSTHSQSDELKTLLTSSYESIDDFEKAFEAYYNKKEEAHRKRYEYCCQTVKEMFSKLLNSYPETYLNLPLSSTYDESLFQDQNKNPNVPAARQSRPRKANPSPTTEFKKPKAPSDSKAAGKEQASHRRSNSAPPTERTNNFKTPLSSSRRKMVNVKTITPKVTNTPMSVMRRPQVGEVAFSTSGSPLFIGGVSLEDIPTVSVPLQDGRVFSILPDPGQPPADLPEFDNETKKYLQTLREHLAKLAPASPE